jgi:hypothetical protein
MKRLITTITLTILLTFISTVNGQTIEQKLAIVQNDGTVSGTFSIELQVKGTGLSSANTLGSATVDINYNNTNLSYVGAVWSFGATEGYITTANDNTTSVRVGVLGFLVSSSTGGIDIQNGVYGTWVRLNFTINNTGGTPGLLIQPASNEVGLFSNHSNDPTGTIGNQTLSAPEVDDAPLPVELSSFTGKQEGDKVSLVWQTKTEVDNYGFDVERKVGKKQWEKIGFVAGNGNSNSPKDYSYADKKLKGGTKFSYRLKQIDTDGEIEYSKEVEVEVVPTKFELYQNYPNPFNPSTTISFALPQAGKVTLKIYNTLGEEVATLADGYMEAGIQTVNFNAGELSSGLYIYRLNTREATFTKKMLLLK